MAVLVFALSTIPETGGHGLGNDAHRYFDIATSTGRPYRDFEVEVPPVALFGFHLLNPGDVRGFAERLGFVMLAADIGIALVLWHSWGRGSAFRYWVIGTPLCVFIYLRVDLLSVLLAVLSVSLAKSRRSLSGPILAAAAFVKVWPLLLAPLLLIERARKAFVAFAAVSIGSFAAWIWWGGADGPMQVLTFRHSTGWEYQSPIGFILWQLGRGTLRAEGGSARVGSMTPATTAVLAMFMLAIMWWAWSRSWNTPAIAEGLGSVVVVATLLVLAPVGSHQYLSWLLPWVAISQRNRLRDWALIASLSAAATALYAGKPIPYSYGIDVTALGIKNLALVVILVAAIVELRRAARTTPVRAMPAAGR